MAKKRSGKSNNAKTQAPKDSRSGASALQHTDGARASDQRCYTIADWRLEKPEFKIEQEHEGDEVRYIVHGDLSKPAPPIRESKYLSRQQHIEIYRWMLLNRRMEAALENLYKQGKVVGGVYFGLGQEACSCSSTFALKKDEWMGPMIRNQGSLLVKGFSARDIMMQYMAKAGSAYFGYV